MRLATLPVVLIPLLALGCPPPKQAPIEFIDDESGLDTGSGEPTAPPAAKGEEAPIGGDVTEEKADMHAKCCVTCKEALEKDQSPREPSEIPCADFTVDLNPWCLEHFREVPTMASECLEAGAEGAEDPEAAEAPAEG